MSILLTFTFEVAVEKQSEYLKATAERIKPFWEAHGSTYEGWKAVDDETSFLKVQVWPDEATRNKGLALIDTDAKPIIETFRSFVTNVSQKNYVRKV